MALKYASRPADYLRVAANYTRQIGSSPNGKPNVVMVHMGRSGSTVLGNLLDQHPDLHWDSEVLMRKRVPRYARLVPLRQKILNDPNRIVQWRMLLASKPIYGFETLPQQVERFDLEMSDYLNGLQNLGICHAIVLERRNVVRLVISLLRALKKGQWHKGGPKPAKSSKETLHVDLENVYGFGKSLLENLDYFSDLNEKISPKLRDYKVLRLIYEDDILPSPLIGYERCIRFLNLNPYKQVSVQFKKVNPYPVREMIENFSEVEDYLTGTRYQSMLYE